MVPSILTIAAAALLGTSAALLLFAAAHDVATRTVPNWMPLGLLGAGLGLRLLNGGLLFGLPAALAVFAAAALCWRRGWMGGADVKLLGAAALLVPPALVLNLLLAVSLAGGGLALVYLVLRPLVGRIAPGKPGGVRPAGLLRRVWRVEQRRIRRREALPYASAIAAGALLVMLPG